jgi:hypothetical protein
MTIQIANSEVAQYHNHLTAIIVDRSISRDRRIIAAHKQKLLELFVRLYEQDEPITYEENFLWMEMGDPALPEEIEKVVRRCRLSVVEGGKTK